MSLVSLVQLLLTGLMVALLPLSMVWISSDASKYRKLVWVGVFLTFDLIMVGAFTRLTDSGLGCPDWPGCYGTANPFLAHADIKAAEALMPTGPVTVTKAWIEMAHRFLAMAIGVLSLGMMLQAWYQWRKSRRPEFAPALPTALFLCVCLQGAFGAWTVTMKLQPIIVTGHLLLAMSLLAMGAWLGGHQDQAVRPAVAAPGTLGPPTVMRRLRWLAAGALLLVFVQIALGGWVSTNYATLACADFPLCGGALVPSMDFEHGFTLWRALGRTADGSFLPFGALVAIHWVHRNFACVVFLGVGYTAWRAARFPALRPTARWIGIALFVQAGTGLATIFLSFPLVLAVLHNGGAALLVLLVTMLNYRAKFQSGLAQRAAERGAATQGGNATPARHHQ